MRRPSDVDLTNGYRFDLKTLGLVGLLVASWYDQRNLAEKRAALQELRDGQVKEQLQNVEAMGKLQQYDIGSIKLALAEAGIKVKKGD